MDMDAENETIEGETIEGETIEGETIEGETIEDEDEEGDAVDEDSEDLTNPAYKGSLPASLLAALLGALLGAIPALLWVFITGKMFYPLFIAAPVFIYLLSLLLKGKRDIPTLIVNIVLSLVSAYLTALACQALLYVIAYNKPFSGILLLVIISIGKFDVLPASASAYAYPLVFTALGIAATWVKLRAKMYVDTEFEADSQTEGETSDETEAETIAVTDV